MKRLLFNYLIGFAAFASIVLVSSCDKNDNTKTNNGCLNIALDPDPNEYIDLGLPSGTRWKNSNENGLYDFESAIETYSYEIPTRLQLAELIAQCQSKWDDSKKGYYFIGPNGNAIFLPAAGFRDDETLRGLGDWGKYWSSSIGIGSRQAYSLFLGHYAEGYKVDCSVKSNTVWRHQLSVRLVQDWDVQNGYVDLGLPSGTKWKTTDETNPNDDHGFFTYSQAMAAHGERLPTSSQISELVDNCKRNWSSMDNGWILTGPNGNHLIFRASGRRDCDGNVTQAGTDGFYMSSSTSGSDGVYILRFNNVDKASSFGGEIGRQCNGYNVRLVQN